MPDRFAFTLAPNETAKLNFSIVAVWENKLEIINEVDNIITEKGNTHGRNQSAISILNNQPRNKNITIIASYKTNDHDHWRASNGIIHSDSTMGGVRRIVYGFEDQNHGAFRNAIIDITIF